MKSRIPFMIGLLLCELTADYFAKQFELKNSMYIYILALFLYVLGNAVWLFAMKHGVGLARGTILFSVASTVGTLLIAYVWYREPTSIVNLIGIGLCIIGLTLMDWE